MQKLCFVFLACHSEPKAKNLGGEEILRRYAPQNDSYRMLHEYGYCSVTARMQS